MFNSSQEKTGYFLLNFLTELWLLDLSNLMFNRKKSSKTWFVVVDIFSLNSICLFWLTVESLLKVKMTNRLPTLHLSIDLTNGRFRLSIYLTTFRFRSLIELMNGRFQLSIELTKDRFRWQVQLSVRQKSQSAKEQMTEICFV